MTRYTNLGRKRTYLEAGFEHEAQAAPANISPQAQEDHVGKKFERAGSGKFTPHKAKRRVKDVLFNDGSVAEDTTNKIAGDKETRTSPWNRGKGPLDPTPFERSEQRRLRRQDERTTNTVCFACREKGHAVKNCPKSSALEKTGSKNSSKAALGICYRCGSKSHTLSRCKKPENLDHSLPYASCFVCSGKGHLASSCPQNKAKGIYPNGGSCKLCEETSHLARNCPMRKQDVAANTVYVGMGRDAGADEDDFHMFKRFKAQVDEEEKREVKGAKKRTEQEVAANFAAKPKKLVFF